MDKSEWKHVTIQAMSEAGTYRECFDSAIDTFAAMMEARDNAAAIFEKTGSNALVKHTNKAGATNTEQNPALRLINDLNRDALAYWRDFGLTPAGLKRINENAMQKPKRSALVEALKEIG